MLIDALTGLGIGAGFALLFLTLVKLRVDRLNQGLLSSAGLAALVACCLWLDGWILTAIPGFALASAGLLALQSAFR